MKWCSNCKKICDTNCEKECDIYQAALPMLTEKEFYRYLEEESINEDIVVLVLSQDENGLYYDHNEVLEYGIEYRTWLHDWYEGEKFYYIGFTKIDDWIHFHALTTRKGIFTI